MSRKRSNARTSMFERDRCFARVVALLALSVLQGNPTNAFQAPICVSSRRRTNLLVTADEVTMSLERAKALLRESKEKLAAKQNGSTLTVDRQEEQKPSQPPLPFFASREPPQSTNNKRKRVTKTVDEETGLITTNGAEMARLSEEEEWEVRSLFEVFENEIGDKDVYSATSQQLATRDVAASIWNLRKTLQNDDYRRIFDKSNRFIGEDN